MCFFSSVPRNFNVNWSNSGVLCESRTNRTPPRASPRCKYVPWILISCDVLPRGDNIDPPPQPLYSRPTASLWLLVTSQEIYFASPSPDVERLLGTVTKHNFGCYRSVSLLQAGYDVWSKCEMDSNDLSYQHLISVLRCSSEGVIKCRIQGV